MGKPSEQNINKVELDPWVAPVLFHDALLNVSFKIPPDWKVERTLDRPLSFIAPPRGNPPFQVLISMMSQPLPPLGAGLLPLVAEQIFSTENEADLPQFEAQPSHTLNLGTVPARLQNCRWLQESGNYKGQIRKTSVVTQVWDQLYVLCLYTSAELTDLASEVFKQLLFTISFGDLDEAGPPEEPVSKVLGKQRDTAAEAPQTAKFVEGRWGSRKG